MDKIEEIIKKEVKRLENVGCEVTNIEVKEYGIKLCPHCGNKIGENNIFCPHCGQKITSGGE